MCGIAGKLSWRTPPSQALVKAMTDEMWRRGPDGDGIYSDNYVALGQRRLAIIDLSPAGRQPMLDHSGKYCITFNGEIYNFIELRRELEKLGAHFKSNTDTEIILEAYKAWGEQAISKLNGMFVFALWDITNEKLILARDRLGKKPLFFYRYSDGSIAFSSELKALLKDPEIPKQLNYEAVSQFLSFGYVLSNSCIISGVSKLKPAHYITIHRNRFETHRYWSLLPSFKNKIKISEEDAAREISNLLLDSTSLRMISDVPLGAFLSGGIDSSAIVSMMCRNTDPSNVKTFSIGFNERGYSELDQARLVAKQLGVTHREEVISADMATNLEEIVYLSDEPIADNSMIPTYYLSKFTRESVTVALSGDGGDEIFSGYETYAADRWHQRLGLLPPGIRVLLGKTISGILPVSHGKVSLDYKVRKFFEATLLPLAAAHASWRGIFNTAEKCSLIKPPHREQVLSSEPFQHFLSSWNELDGANWLDQAMNVDINTWLADDILVKADRMSMAHSLEVRAPLLDYRLVEFAASLPVEFRMSGFQKKYIFKKAMRENLPKEIIYRTKRGFNAPVAHWINSSLKPLLDRVFNSSSPFSELFENGAVNELISQHLNKKADNSFKIFNLLNLGIWLNNVFLSSALASSQYTIASDRIP